ncbi:MAG: hypothetical protein ACLQU3_27325 [Limisphaerales bacterium]
MKTILNVIVAASCIVASSRDAHAQTTNSVHTPQASRSYRDSNSGTIFYLESDGHHVVALDREGKVLWCRQPALDGNLPPYSKMQPRANPLIVWIGALSENEKERLKNTGSGKFIGISFNSRQAGVLDVKSGDFTFQGQN